MPILIFIISQRFWKTIPRIIFGHLTLGNYIMITLL